MRLGATLAHLTAAEPYPVGGWARRLAGEGFESLWIPQILGRGFFVPDAFVALATAAAVTDGVELGTATLQVPLHHPVALAHRIRSLQAECGDRLVVGLSPGSTDTDHGILDRDFTARFRTFDANVARLRALLDEQDPVDLSPPVPARPPLLLGSWGAKVERAAREFDGWLASGYRRTPDEIVDALVRFRESGGGRAVVCAVPAGPDTDPRRLRADLQRYAGAGFDDAVILFEPGGPDPGAVRALL
ncbi:LLM class flavin-dependent oxidoreductase [Nakamurella sp. YIM 132087]|uniref:LLM class flavin-dependent oxidoreductase n=1 Tax=Nakamurella alba TaxID=2665158 RepID=A0A7K1FKH3_9ACTN|nr:LLM class flavin-dependent oxidoreductase [Nakamurella alba]MTD14586.1 LLM class flavin-dependent oxidoreductase [Nakamurella alba]